MATKKIQWGRLLVKAGEDGMKKTIELIALALIVGATSKVMFIAVPAITIASIFAKLIKIKFLG